MAAETKSGSDMACLGPRLGVVGLDMTDSVEKKGSRDTTVQAFAGKRGGTTNILRGPLTKIRGPLTNRGDD